MSKLDSQIESLNKKLIETYNGITEDWKNVGHIRCYDGLLEPIRVLLREIQNAKDCEKRVTEENRLRTCDKHELEQIYGEEY
ncbi:MAG: hypothetical protein J6Y37_02145 [Paludibacteraceae bacterium]|nr:hypothetical protein [Paludibacteraceae bacterium]